MVFYEDFDLLFDFWNECEVMYKFIMSIGVRKFLEILKASSYGDMLFGVGILVIFSV